MEELLQVVEKILQDRPFGSIHRFVFHQAWLGKTYGEMAEVSGYGCDYVKEIGSQMWQDLSAALGKRVTKKNLHIVLRKYLPKEITNQETTLQQDFRKEHSSQKIFSELLSVSNIDFPSGPVPLNSPLYIERPPLEELVCNEIIHPGCLIRIKAPRKMGKSSLLNRMIAHAKEQGYQIVYLDFQEADEDVFASLDKFLRWFCVYVSRQLNILPSLDDFWDTEMGSKVSCKIYFEAYLLQYINNSPVVLALNEVNRVFEHPNIAQDFLPMLRFWHEQAKQDQTWQKLRLVVVHTTEIYIPLKLNQSPFNVGITVPLPSFTLRQVQDLALSYGLDWAADEAGAKHLVPLQEMIGGHPYLVNLALYYLCQGEMTLEVLLQTASTPTGIYSPHLRELLTLLQQDPQLVLAMQQVIAADVTVELDAIAAYKLESMGLVQLNGNQARVSCELYRFYFSQQLGKQNGANTNGTLLENKQQKYLLESEADIMSQFVNLQHFKQYLETQWQEWQTSTSILSLIVCEIDHLKIYYETYGEIAGNSSLQKIASTIRNCLKNKTVLIAHYEGTKFAAILPQTNADTAVGLAENIREKVNALAITHAPQLKKLLAPSLTVSVGLATTNTTSKYQTSPTILITAAEEALFQSKRRGYNCFTLNSVFSEKN